MAKSYDVSLLDIYENYQMSDGGGDKGTAHSYIEIYNKVLRPDADFCEIGVYMGHSLAMFQQYFSGQVIGLDINLDLLLFKVPAVICDATNKEKVAETLGSSKFDYIIDDGSHELADQLSSLEIFWDFLKPGGIYFIEDIQNVDAVAKLVGLLNSLNPDKIWFWDLRSKKGRQDDLLLAARKVD